MGFKQFEFLILSTGTILLTFPIMLRLIVPGQPGWQVLSGAIKNILAQRRFAVPVGLLLLFVAIDLAETLLDPWITQMLGWDFTPLIYRLEGDSVAYFQLFHAIWLTYTLIYIYAYAFTVMLICAVLLSAYWQDLRLMKVLCLGYGLNFIIVLPFYIFFPVNGTWIASPGLIKLRLDEITPLIGSNIKYMSADNNCFPSLHTSLAWTLLYASAVSGKRRLFWINVVLCLGVVYSTLYLGVHWVSDMLAGSLLAGLVCLLLHYYLAGPRSFQRKS